MVTYIFYCRFRITILLERIRESFKKKSCQLLFLGNHLNFRFRSADECFKFTFQSKNKDLKATCPMKSGRIGVQENMFFSNMTITKQRPRRLRLKLFKLRLSKFEMKNSCIYGSKRITRTDNVGKTELLPLRAPERISDQAFN